MKACLIQPLYSTDTTQADRLFEWEIDALCRCDESMDIIVLPEYSDVPCFVRDRESFLDMSRKYADKILMKSIETAKRCRAIVFLSILDDNKNTTVVFDRQGSIAGKYHKQHLTDSEVIDRKLDSEYSFEFSTPYIVELEGLRFGFLTCYDFYFYENFSNIARFRPDIIIGCSHQRTDTHDALEMMTKFCAYNTNSYILRASVSMGEEQKTGGASMAVAPDGGILLNMKSRVGMECVEFDPKKKYYKPAGFSNPDSAHFEYVEKGRRPWKYRPAGSAIARYDKIMPYPRICAHRGFSTIAPENSMPAFGAAVALGADEIEFDLWYTKDGQIVSTHDKNLSRTSDGDGFVYDYTYEQLMKLDFGVKFGKEFCGLKITSFEDILKKFACHTIMNIHIKTEQNDSGYDPKNIEKILSLIDKYDCRRHVYFMCGNDRVLKMLKSAAPDICLCQGAGDRPWDIVERALENGCQKVQLFKPYVNRQMIEKAHEHGLRCNLFYTDDREEAREYLDMGIDTILTNDYYRISRVIKD